MAVYRITECPQCGVSSEIRSDRTYCSISCASKAHWEKTRESKKWRTILVGGDAHILFQNQPAVALFVAFARETQPDIVVLNGDWCDCHEISVFCKDLSNGETLKSELGELETFLSVLRAAVPDASIYYVEGNHEHRLETYIFKNAPALAGIDAVKFPELAKLRRHDVTWVPCGTDSYSSSYMRFGPVLVGHFDIVRKYAGYTAKAILDDYGMSAIQAHVHSMGMSHKTIESGEIACWEGGCLCDLNPTYCKPRKWVNGFHVIHQEVDGEFFHVEPIMIINNKFFYGGELWR